MTYEDNCQYLKYDDKHIRPIIKGFVGQNINVVQRT